MKNKFTKDFFTSNRKRLCESLPNHLLVLTAHSLVQLSADRAFPFQQERNFWYLTGINEPDLVLMIDTVSAEATLVLPTKNDYQNLWDGEFDQAIFKEISGIQKCIFKEEFESFIRKNINSKKIGILGPAPDRIEPYGYYANPARKNLKNLLIESGFSEDKLIDIRLDIARLRQIKQPVEVEYIQKAIDITKTSLDDIKYRLNSFKNEKELERELTIGFLQYGATTHAFDPIVASGKNATTIHYEKNNSNIKKSDLVLLDVGAQFGMYGADISRTWQIDKISDRQKQVYDSVKAIHLKVIEHVAPGVRIKELQELANSELKKQCRILGISNRELPHGISHYLGLDIHDAGDYLLPLEAGTVLTVEPGLYMPEENIGVRIEDDILVTERGSSILSENISLDL